MTSGFSHPHLEDLYWSLAHESLTKAKEINKIKNNADAWEIKKHLATCLVFSALCLEAFINQQWFKNGLEYGKNTSHESKWSNLPNELGIRRSFKKKDEPFRTFLDLVELRNHRLVHFHPKNERREIEEEYEESSLGELLENISEGERLFACVDKMIRKLHDFTNGKTELPGFLKGDIKFVDLVVFQKDSLGLND